VTPERLAFIRAEYDVFTAQINTTGRKVDPNSLYAYLGELLEEVNSLGVALAAAQKQLDQLDQEGGDRNLGY
jgi:hypothetical protein